MKRILVPTDFSKHAEYALKVAADLAKKYNAEIFLNHILELPHQGSDAVSHGHDIPEVMFFKNATARKLDELAESDYLEGLNVSKIIQLDHAFEGIMKSVTANNIDLIVMGSHGASGVKEMFVGSNAEKVVRNSSVPVLVLKSEKENFNINDFVFASDFSDEIKKPFENVLKFVNEFGATLHLVKVITPNSFKSTRAAQKSLNDFISNYAINNYKTHIYNDYNVEAGILNIADDLNADLIGMCTHGRKGLSHFFNGSISESLVNHSQRPVITFKI
ncbi:MAG: universal stress protein [Limnohabitans sp.]|nr:universal stress protein [Limnohabitans sp.]